MPLSNASSHWKMKNNANHQGKKKTSQTFVFRMFWGGAPTGIRTPVLALKGLRPGPLDDGG